MNRGCRKTVPYEDVFRQLQWMAEDGSTTDAAPALPKKKERKLGGIYAELTDSSSSSSSSSDESAGSSGAESAGPTKFAATRDKLKLKAKDETALAKMESGPICPACGKGLLKPDAVYFGEGMPKGLVKKAISLSRAAKAFLIIGTSGQVAPACLLPKMAKEMGKAKVIEISPRETDLSETADLLLLGTAATVLPALCKE